MLGAATDVARNGLDGGERIVIGAAVGAEFGRFAFEHLSGERETASFRRQPVAPTMADPEQTAGSRARGS